LASRWPLSTSSSRMDASSHSMLSRSHARHSGKRRRGAKSDALHSISSRYDHRTDGVAGVAVADLVQTSKRAMVFGYVVAAAVVGFCAGSTLSMLLSEVRQRSVLDVVAVYTDVLLYYSFASSTLHAGSYLLASCGWRSRSKRLCNPRIDQPTKCVLSASRFVHCQSSSGLGFSAAWLH
jgi:hypothetical protein